MIGRIYVIYHIDKIVVVGSTERTIDERWSRYKSAVNNPDQNSNTHTMMREYGIDNYEIELLEEVEVETENQMFAIEGMWQDTFEDLGIKLYNTNRARGEPRGSPEYLATKREKQREKRADPEYRARENERKRQPIQCELCGASRSRGNIRSHQRSNYCMENRC